MHFGKRPSFKHLFYLFVILSKNDILDFNLEVSYASSIRLDWYIPAYFVSRWHSAYHIGVAVDTDRGLLVPVVRHVDCKSITDIAKELYDLAERTRSGRADVQDMTGGSFTITNVGPLGGTGFTPIINYPQVAILGLGRSRLRAVVRGDMEDFEIVPRLILPLSLGFDHRVVDGADGARFMGMIINTLENPENLVMMA